MKIKFNIPAIWSCQGCSYNGIPEDDEVCDLCEYSGSHIKEWIKEREMVNFLIEEFNKGNLLLKP